MKISEYLSWECSNRKWLADRIKQLKYNDMELDDLLSCPSCKQKASFRISTESDGYCNHIVANINCTNCRIQTKHRCVDGYYGSTDTIDDVINDWNNRV